MTAPLGTSRRAAVFALAGAMVASGADPARAQAAPGPASVYLEELTSPELAARVARGATIALVPVGGTEQSGAHLALGKHDARVRVLAGRIAQKLGNAIVAPVLAYVPEGGLQPPTAHMRYPGTLTVPEPVFESLLVSTARSLQLAGFRDVFFLGDHGGYQASLKRAADAIEHGPAHAGGARGAKAAHDAPAPFHAHALETYYRVTQTAYVDALKARDFTPAEIGQHAGLADTSLSMALAPETVRGAALAAASSPQTQPGVAGDPRRSTVALGQLGADLIVEQSVAAIRAVAGRP